MPPLFGTGSRKKFLDAAKEGNEEAVCRLLQSGKEPEKRDEDGRAPIHIAVLYNQAGVLRLLLRARASPDVVDRSRWTPLHYAVRDNRLEMVQDLLAAGALPNVKDGDGRAPLHVAMECGRVQAARLLLQGGAATNVVDSYGDSYLHMAAARGQVEIVQALLDARADPNWPNARKATALHAAVFNNQPGAVLALLAGGANPDPVECEGWSTPLHSAAERGSMDAIQALLQAGANPGATDVKGATPLHRAAESGRVEAVRLLLRAGVLAVASDCDGDSALHKCARGWQHGSRSEEYLACAMALLGAGASPDATNRKQETPRSLAAHRGALQLQKLLSDASGTGNLACPGPQPPVVQFPMPTPSLPPPPVPGPQPYAPGPQPPYPPQPAMTRPPYPPNPGPWPPEPNTRPQYPFPEPLPIPGNTKGLHEAAAEGDVECIRRMLQAGARLEDTDKEGATPLHRASWTGKVDAIRVLLAMGASVGSRNSHGAPPLHQAVRNGKVQAVRELLLSGADVAATDSQGDTALHEVVRCWDPVNSQTYLEIARALLAANANAYSANFKGQTPRRMAADEGIVLLQHAMEEAGGGFTPTPPPLPLSLRPPMPEPVLPPVAPCPVPFNIWPDKQPGPGPAPALGPGLSTGTETRANVPDLLCLGFKPTPPIPPHALLPLRPPMPEPLQPPMPPGPAPFNFWPDKAPGPRPAPALNPCPALGPAPSLGTETRANVPDLLCLDEPKHPPKPAPSSSYVIHASKIKLEQLLGSGSFAEVYRARWQGTTVAAKKIKIDGWKEGMQLPQEELASMEQEAALMSRLRHPNIVAMFGICYSPPIVVMELCGKDSLATVLAKALQDPVAAAQLTWPLRVNMLLDAARGMVYLHNSSPPVVHRDLKPPNLLVDEHWRVKVADFGLSKLKEFQAAAASKSSNYEAHNPRWLAPELALMTGHASPASDVFAFGLVMWEVLTWQIPWSNMMRSYQILGCLMQKMRPPIPACKDLPGPDTDSFAALNSYLALMERCWQEDPAQRPDFEYILEELSNMLPEDQLWR